jgi:hypothetical protein
VNTGRAQPISYGIGPRLLSYAEVRELYDGHVPLGCKKYDAWFDENDASMCFFVAKNLNALVVRVFVLRHGDIFFEEESVAVPIKLWLQAPLSYKK